MIKFIRSGLCFFWLISSIAYARVAIQVEAETNHSNSTVLIKFTGQEAKKLWEYLERIHHYLGSYVLEEHDMSKTHLSSPAIHCIETNYQVFANIPAKDPSLYDCYIRLSQYGLPVVPG